MGNRARAAVLTSMFAALLLGCSSKPEGQVSVANQVAENVTPEALDALQVHYRGCYNTALAGNPAVQGKLAYTLVDCPVCSPRVSEDTLNDPKLTSCVVSKIRKDTTKIAGMLTMSGGGKLRLTQELTFQLGEE